MKVAITGCDGFIATHLIDAFIDCGDEIVGLSRHKGMQQGIKKILWDPMQGILDTNHLEDLDLIINLAGENIVGRYSEEKKKRVWQSRVDTTAFLVDKILTLKNPPKYFFNASAVGFYGDRGEIYLTERSPRGEGFLAELVEAWEESTRRLESKGIKVVLLRLGAVIASDGGILKRMNLPFKWGLGVTFGSGQQWMSWIAVEDVVGAIDHIMRFDLQGAINVTSPNSVRQLEWSRAVAKQLQRPLFFHLNASKLRWLLKEGAEPFLNSERAFPEKLIASGYTFIFPTLSDALKNHLPVNG